MDICLVYYERYKGTVTAEDHYIPWAISLLEEGCMSDALNMLAGLQKPYNLFEVEEYVKRTISDLTLFVPTYEQAVAYKTFHHLTSMLKEPDQILTHAKILGDMAIEEDKAEYLDDWLAIGYAVDEFEDTLHPSKEERNELYKEISKQANRTKTELFTDSSDLLSYKRY